MKKTFLSACLFFVSVFVGIGELNAMRDITLNVGNYDETINTRKVELCVGGNTYNTDTNKMREMYSQNEREIPALPDFHLDYNEERIDDTLESVVYLKSDYFSVGFTVNTSPDKYYTLVESHDGQNDIYVNVLGGLIDFGCGTTSHFHNLKIDGQDIIVIIIDVSANDIDIEAYSIFIDGSINARDTINLKSHIFSSWATIYAEQLKLTGIRSRSEFTIKGDIHVGSMKATGLNFIFNETLTGQPCKLCASDTVEIHCTKQFLGRQAIVEVNRRDNAVINVEENGRYEPASIRERH